MTRYFRVDYTVKPDVDLDNLKADIYEFVAAIRSHHPEHRYTSFQDPAKPILPYYELRTKLGLEGETAEQIAAGVEAAYAKGEIPKRNEVNFAYMWSADRILGPAGHWHPHMRVYLPYYENAMLGNNAPGSYLNWPERRGTNQARSTCSVEISHRSGRIPLSAAPQVPGVRWPI